MNQIISGIGDAVGGLLFGQGWNAQDPKEAFRLFAPPNLLDVFSPEEQDAYGEMIRRQMRQPGSHNRPSWAQIQTSISEAAKTKLQQQAAQEQAAQLRSLLGEGASPQPAMPQGGSPQPAMPQGGPQQMPAAGGAQPMPAGMPTGMGAAGPQMPQGSPDVQEPPMGLAAAGMGQQQPPGPAAMSVQEGRRATAERYRRGAEYLLTVGRDKEAKVLFDKAKELDPTENFLAPVAGVDPQGKPVFMQPSNQGGQRTMEGVAPPPAELPSSLREYRYAVDNEGYQGNFESWLRTKYEAQRPQTTVNLPPNESEYAKFAGQASAKRHEGLVTGANKSVRNAAKLENVIDLLRTGDPNTGLGAELMTNIERVKAMFTQSGKTVQKVSDTELLEALLGSDVFPQIGELGIGARGLDTEAERKFLQKVITGDISMNKETLVRMAQMRRKYQIQSIKDYNEAVQSGELDRWFNYTGTPKRLLPVPEIKDDLPAAPSPVEEAVRAERERRQRERSGQRR